jgi:2-succinyl-5-enolpyruvyl-6-hydroxy-3-cyclohexene-1-carboxylate synthase
VKVCAGFGVSVVKVSSSAELQKVMSKAVNGLEIVIIQVPDREVNAKELKAISQSISSAVRIGINLA